MRIMLDENVPRQLTTVLQGHVVSTVLREGWGGIKNGDLLDRIENHFDVLITSDNNMRHQNRFVGRRLSLVILPTNDLNILRASAAAIARTRADIAQLGFPAAIEIDWKGRRRMRRLDLTDAPMLDIESVQSFTS